MIIDFKKTIGTKKIAGRGILVGEYFVVSYSLSNKEKYQIYKLHNGKLFISTEFSNLDDTVEFAQWINDTYKDFLCIWSSYPDADIIALSKWSVKNGIRIFELLNEIQNKQVDKGIIQSAWSTTQNRIHYWIRGIKYECTG